MENENIFRLADRFIKNKILIEWSLFEEGIVGTISCQTLNMVLLSIAKFCGHDRGMGNICDKRKIYYANLE